jgi:hypothetical protein
MRRTLIALAARPVMVGIAFLAGAALAVPAGAQSAACGPFRVEWNRAVLSPTAEKLEGFVYNESSCVVADVRLHVVAVNAEGRAVAETLGWVHGDIGAGARGYFVLPMPDAPAADYRVEVMSFDQVSSGRFPLRSPEAP